MLLTSSTLPLARSRAFICLLPGVTPVALRDVGACATLPCPVQDWPLHGKNHPAAAVRSGGAAGTAGHAPDPLPSVSLQFNRPLLRFVRPQTSSSCLRFTVAWLLNKESSLIHSSRCLQPYQASVGCKLAIKSMSGL